MVMAVPSPRVRYEGVSGPSSAAVRGLSLTLTDLRRERSPRWRRVCAGDVSAETDHCPRRLRLGEKLSVRLAVRSNVRAGLHGRKAPCADRGSFRCCLERPIEAFASGLCQFIRAGGEVATGRPKSIPGGNISTTVKEIGLTSIQDHEARAVRDAEKADPGVVRGVTPVRGHETQGTSPNSLVRGCNRCAARALRG
jgi:hypothetical protein